MGTVEDVETIAVLGAGSMGHGIAEVASLAEYDVHLRDIEEEYVQRGYEQIDWSLGKLVEQELIDTERAEAALDRVRTFVDLEAAVSDADLVIEAVPEKLSVKEEVYELLEKHLPADAIVASNTSSLSITALSEMTDRPAAFCGMHFFNPPVRMQLVEVIAGDHTSEATLDRVEQVAESFQKTPVRVKRDEPGFIVNRILVPLMNEACWLVSEEEATVSAVDSTTKFDMGLPMGAFELGDQVGNDITLHVLEYMQEELGEGYAPAPLLAETVAAGDVGQKAGSGFYEYGEDDGVTIPPDGGDPTIEARLLATMANEVGELVEAGVSTPADIDEAVTLGAGFPTGPASLADDHGLGRLIAVLEGRQEETGHPRYQVSDGLREAATDGGFRPRPQADEAAEFDAIELSTPAASPGVGHIELAREARLNTISTALLSELEQAIDSLEADEDVRVVLITGKGDRAFSAGADVTSMAASADPLSAIELSREGQRIFGRLETTSMVTIAGVDGYALGGGMELAMCCDLRLASERSELGQPELTLGLLPGWGGTQRLRRIVGEGRAKEIILTADRYDAETMFEYGFINEVVPTERFQERLFEYARELAAGPPVAQELTKRAMHAGRDDIDAGLEIEAQAFGHLIGTDDLMAGMTAFVSDEDPVFEGK